MKSYTQCEKYLFWFFHVGFKRNGLFHAKIKERSVMVYLVIGVPGSGKTYYSVNEIYKLVIAEKKKYKHIYTNINGFNYDKANELANIKDYVKPFEFDDLNIHIQNEYEFFNLQKSKKLKKNIALKKDSDFELIVEPEIITDYDEECKSKGIYAPYLDSLIIVDECHLYFEDKVDDPKIRFLSYHRHFNIDIILITQGKSLIHKKYLSFVETMFLALSGAKRFLSTRFRYRKYASYQEYAQNLIETISISLDSKVFELYNSGAAVLSKSALSKFLIPVLVGIVVVFSFYKLFISDRYNKTETPKQNTEQNQTVTQQNTKDSNSKIINTDETDFDKKPFFAVTCFKKTCNFQNVDYSFDESTMYKFVNSFNCKILIADNHVPFFTVFAMRCDKDLNSVLNLYKKNNSQRSENETTPHASILSN